MSPWWIVSPLPIVGHIQVYVLFAEIVLPSVVHADEFAYFEAQTNDTFVFVCTDEALVDTEEPFIDPLDCERGADVRIR